MKSGVAYWRTEKLVNFAHCGYFAKGDAMANVKKGQTVRPPQWWKHLKWCKRVFWKKQRRADKRDTQKEIARVSPRES